MLPCSDQSQQLLFTSSSKKIWCYDRLNKNVFPSLLRLRYKSSATCISITSPYSASEYAHSIKLYIHTIPSPLPKHVSLFISSVFVPSVSFRKWKHRHNGMKAEEKRRFMLCPRYTESRRDRNKFIAFDSSAELLLYSHSMFQNWTILYCHRGHDDRQKSSTKYTVEIGYNVMKGRGYFVSLYMSAGLT